MSLIRRVTPIFARPPLRRPTAALGSTLQGRQSWEGAFPPADPVGHSNVLLYNQNLPASGTLALDPGNFFFLFAAAASVNVSFFYDQGNIEQMLGFPVGTQIRRVKPWRRVQITGTGGTNVEFWHGYAFTREDTTDFKATIATIAGGVSTTPGIGSSNAMGNHADVNVATVTLDATITANAARKILIVGSLAANAPASINLRLQGGAGTAAVQGIELAPGVSISLPISSACAVYNGDANAQKYFWQEVL